MNEQDLKRRTKDLALRAMKLADSLPQSHAGRTVANQLVRSATSVGANYRSACRGKSKADFIAKLAIALEEADECGYWLELVIEGELLQETRVRPLLGEAEELTAILAASCKSARRNSALVAESAGPNRKSKIENRKYE